jgi:hypothetical protein
VAGCRVQKNKPYVTIKDGECLDETSNCLSSLQEDCSMKLPEYYHYTSSIIQFKSKLDVRVC